MPDLSLSQALVELAALKNRTNAPPTIAELQDIVVRTRVTQVDPINKSIDRAVVTKATLLYSGSLSPNVASFDIANALAKVNPELSIINKTHVGELLELNSTFYNEVRIAAQRQGLISGPADFQSFLNGPSGGFWSKASERFTLAGASGDFVVIAPNAAGLVDPETGLLRPNSVFGTVELKALLDGGATGRINGITIADLRARYTALSQAGGSAAASAAALTDIAEIVSVKSASDMWSAVKVVPGSSGVDALVKVEASFFSNNGVSGVGAMTSTGYTDGQARFAYNLAGDGSWFTSQSAKTFFSKAKVLKALGVAGKVAGPLGDLIEVGALAGAVIGQLNAGDRDGAARTAAAGLGSLTGGALAAATAATWASPLLAGGPAGWIGYIIVVGWAGLIGSGVGQAIGDRGYTFFSQTLPDGNPAVWIADGLGVAHQFITTTLPDGLSYAARLTRELINGELDIVKFFTGDNSTPEQADIIVTANRRTGQTSVSNLPSYLQNNAQLRQELGQALLDFARSGETFHGDSGTAEGGYSNRPTPSSLAEARAVSSVAGQQIPATPVLRYNSDGTVTVGAVRGRIIGTDDQDGFRIQDSGTGSLIDIKVYDVAGVPTFKMLFERNYSGQLNVTKEYNTDGSIKNTALRLGSNPNMVMFSDAAGILGDNLGYRLAGGNKLTGALYSATVKTLGQNLGEAVDAVVFGAPANIGENIEAAFSDVGNEFLTNLKSAGIGALSSYLTAELVNAVGIDGIYGEWLQTSSGAYLTEIIANLPQIISGAKSLGDVLGSVNVGNIAGSFVGAKLAALVWSPDTIGGQIGAAVGSAIGAIAVTELAKVGTLLAGPAGAVVGAFVGFLVGGLIGSLFGGTPRSGADSQWDEVQQKFVVANVYARKGGSKEAASSVASAVSETFNSVLAAANGTLLNAKAVQSGNYGMRKKDFVYRPESTRDTDAITQRFSGKNAAQQLIGYGIYQGLSDPDFQIAGGDVYVKRALYNSFSIGGIDPRNFDSSVVFGNMSAAQQYESYLANANVINALVSAEPNSVFTVETLLTLARADELGLTRRAASDWFGGFSFLIQEEKINATAVEFGFDYDSASGQVSRLIALGNYTLSDSIDIAGQTTIEATASADTIDLRSGALASQIGYTVNGHLNSDIAQSGADFTAKNTMLNFTGGGRSAAMGVQTTADALAEAGETFDVTIGNAVGVKVVGPPAAVTIVAADAAPTLMVGRSYVGESEGIAFFRVSLSKAASTAVTLSLALTDGRATAGVDYSTAMLVSADGNGGWASASTLTLAAGVTQYYVRVPVIADNGVDADGKPTNIEGNETFTLTATVTAGASALANGATPVSGIGTIIDGASSVPYAWLDDQVVHEGAQAALWAHRSKYVNGNTGSVQFATSDRARLDIAVAATVDGGAGNDTIYASNLGDNLFGGAGDDTLYGGRLDDWLLGGEGNDTLDAGTADVAALGGDGNYLDGGAGNDILRGREGSDWLEGGEGVDVLTGGAGDDILAGGVGDGDDLKGGTGADQYLVRRGDGLDIAEEDASGAPVAAGAGDAITQRMAAIEQWKLNPAAAGGLRPDWVGTSTGVQGGAVAGGDDAVVFGTGIDIGDVQLQRSGTGGAPGNDLIVRVMTTVNGVETFSGTQLTIKDWFVNPFKRVEWLRFADGNEIRIGDITSFVVGGSGNDVLIGTNGNDFVYGGAGNDKLLLLGGDDVGNGGTGDDMVAGDTGRDLLIGGLGNDELIGGAGADAITGDAGADDIYGGADRDTLSGGRGDGDVVIGGGGDDMFRYARGDGRDMYIDELAEYWSVVWTSAGQWNTAAGFNYNDSTGEVTGPGGVLIRKNVGTAAEPDLQWVGRYDYDSAAQTLKIYNPPANAPTITANAGVDTIEFAPGINLQDVILRRPAASNDLVFAISSEAEELADTSLAKDSITIKDWYLAPGLIEKLAFYQTGVLDIAPAKITLIAGTDGADGAMATPLQGTAVADWITGAAGDDVIAGGNGNDILAGNSGFDTLKGEAGSDVLYGGTGNDTLDGGVDGDVLIGGAGQDVASYASASAAVRAQLSASFANSGDAAGDEYYAIEDLTGSSGNDVLGGDLGQNELVGGVGNDTLEGNGGDDTYVWNVGDGADTITDASFVVQEAVSANGTLATGYSVKSWAKTGAVDAGTGNHYWRLQVQGPDGTVVYDNATYSYAPSAVPAAPTPAGYVQTGWLGGFGRTNGQQVTRQFYDAAVNGGSDELEFGAGISLTDLTFIKSGNDLIVRYGGAATSQVTIKNQLLANSAIETLKFNDGLSVALNSIFIAASGVQLAGTVGDDLLAGQVGALADDLSGGGGNDALVGYAGNDNLYGGDGNDTLEGGSGADRLDGGTNSASGDGPYAGDTARYARSVVAVTVNLSLGNAAQGGATGADSVGDVLIGIENIVGSAFRDTLTGDAQDNRLFGLGDNDTIRGGAGNDVLSGDGASDYLYGDVGEDSISGGDGDDMLAGGADNDTLDGGEGNDSLYGEAGKDTLTAGTGNDFLNGGADDDLLSGGDGDDRLDGDSGNDTLSGGRGADQLNGQYGDDIYLFDRLSGADQINDLDGSNAITFDSSVAYDQIWLTRSGDNLRIGVIGGDTVITVTNYFVRGGDHLHAINTITDSIFLDHLDTLNLITAMTAATATPATTPARMPAAVSGLLATYWHPGGKAVPTGPAVPRTVTLLEDGVITLDGNYGVVDHDKNVTTFSLKADAGPAKGTISNFNSWTGALTYTPFADVNGADSFVVIATDADGQSVALPVQLTITPVNDAPRNLAVAGGAALSILESAPGSLTNNGSVVGQMTALDVEGDAITFTLADNAGGRFTITPTGELRVLVASLLDREIASTHQIRVTATDTYGAAATASFTVTIGNVNEAPNAPVLVSAARIATEFVSGINTTNVGTSVAQFTTSDPDGAPAPTLAFLAGATGNTGVFFKIVGNQVQFALEPDFEALASAGYAITDSDGDGFGEVTLTGNVVASDGLLISANATSFAVKVEDVNQIATAITLNAPVASIDERDRLAAGVARPAVILGTLSVIDPDLPGQLTGQHNYLVFEGTSTTVSSRFGVNASNQLMLLADKNLDYETDGSSITLRVRASDKSSSPLSFDQTFVFAINNKDDVVEGTAAADTLFGQQNRDILRGLAGNDRLYGGTGNDQLEGGDGNDTLYGEDGNDVLLGQIGNDALFGGAGDDNLSGNDGDDVLDGGVGNDFLSGGAGNEGTRAVGLDAWRGFTVAGLIGGDGNDTLNGGDGDDYLDGGLGADQLNGGLGFDGVSYEASSGTVTVNLATGLGSGGGAQGDSYSGIELVQGSAYNDTITGSTGSDVLYGGGGDDIINGGAGNDFLLGGAGNDTLDAEAGNDYLDGGAGNDILIGGTDSDTYFVARNQGNDRVRNFDPTGTAFDHLTFDSMVLYTDIWFDRVDDAGVTSATGNNLKLTLLGAAGTEGSVTVENWFTIPDRTLPANYFKIDLISDGSDRAALPVNVDSLVSLMASIPVGNRPTTQAQMASLRSGNQNVSNGMEEYWGRLSPPRIRDTVTVTGTEPLDDGTQIVSFAVRAWFQDDQNLGVVIPASNIDLTLTTADGSVLSSFVTAVDTGTPDPNGNRTVKLTLAPNASTHLLPGGVLPLQLQAKIRGTTRTTFDALTLSIAPTADTPSFTQLASAGGNAGSSIALAITAGSADTDGSERVDVLIKGLPSGYRLTNAADVSVGTFEGGTTWRLRTADLVGLRIAVSAGSYQNAVLSVAAQSIDGTSTATSPWMPLTVIMNGAPTGVTLTGSIAENSLNGAFVGTLAGLDPDTAEGAPVPSGFQLLNNAGGRYVLDTANTSRLLIASGGATNFDYEANNRDALHTITVRVFDSTGLYVDRNVVVSVANVNEAPNAPSGGARIQAFFNETGAAANAAAQGGTVATFTLSDPDGTTPTLRFAANGNPNNWFAIVGNQVRFNVSNYDFETLRLAGNGSNDANGDGVQDALAGSVFVEAWDGAIASGKTELQVYISDANERPNNLIVEASNIFSETLNGEAPHAGKLIARFTMADPDGPSPTLEIVGGNPYEWFTAMYGNHVAFTPPSDTMVVDFSAGWLRANKGQLGMDADFSTDYDNDGLKEIRVATLTLRAKDAYGAYSDPFLYNVLIEEKNEAPVWNATSLSIGLNENAAAYQQVGQIQGVDVDDPVSAMRYVFGDGPRYYDTALGQWVSRSPDQLFLMGDNGMIYVNGTQSLDYDVPNSSHAFAYAVKMTDRAGGANAITLGSTVTINLQPLNEQHILLNSSGSRAEGVDPGIPVGLPEPYTFNLRNLMLRDPENGAMQWTFANGTNVSGIWALEGLTGRLYLAAGQVDYEALTTRYDTATGWDEYGNPYEYQVPVRDYSLATQNLAIIARDGQFQAAATFAVTITDVAEGPSLGWSPHFIVRDDQGEGYFATLQGFDPETGAAATRYSISLYSSGESYLERGDSADVDNFANPNVTIGNDGSLRFMNPGDGEWEGGIKNHPTLGGRWYYQLDYYLDVTMWDASGVSNTERIRVTFLKHDTSYVLPVVLDLDGDGVELIDSETSAITFDMDLDGVADRTGWVGADDGMLVMDRNGNGTIDDAREISFVQDDENAVTDLEGLRAWDTNRDGFLDSGDQDFARFRIWRDINQNGVSDSGELFQLGTLGITQINLTLNLTGAELAGDHNVVYATSQFHLSDSTTGTAGDVALSFTPSKIDVDDGIAAPIVLDLDDDNAGLVALTDGTTLFDMNGDGIADKTGWIEQGDALLALDRNGNGTIDNIGEISFIGDKAGAKTDLEGLAAFDSNSDGLLDGQDTRFVEFRLWLDRNADGKTDAGELLSLAEAGVASISLAGVATGETPTTGQNIIYNIGSYTLAGGQAGRLLDAGFAFKALSALPAITMQASNWESKGKRYSLTTGGGSLHVTPRYAEGTISADAGLIGPASLLSFADRDVGMLSTIIVDLDGDGLEARRGARTDAAFDMDGDGTADDTGWVSGGDGLLVIDRDGDGAITHASELSFLSEKKDAKSAWDGLSALDNTKDGKLDASDARFGELKIWADRNGDGISQAGEVRSLGDLGITEIGMRTTPTTDSAKIGYNVPLSVGTFTRSNGVTATIGNIALAFDPSSAKGDASVGIPSIPTALEVSAAARASSLLQAMSSFGPTNADGGLQSLAQDRQIGSDWFTAAAA